MYPCLIIAKHGHECQFLDDRSQSIRKSTASHHNCDAATPSLPQLQKQIIGIAQSRDHTLLCAHFVINNRMGQRS